MNKVYSMSDYQSSTADQSGPYTIALASGKGGVGKSFVASSLAICFARMSYRVCLIDLDFGSANIHTYLGMVPHGGGLTDFIKDRVTDINQLMLPSGINNLSIISGNNDSLDMANVTEDEYSKILAAIPKLSCDVVILDLGAGTGNSTLDSFASADLSLMTVTPEPTSIENAYRFLKSAFYRKLKVSEHNAGVQEIIEEAMDQQNQLNIRSPKDLLNYLNQNHMYNTQEFMRELESFELGIILNQVRSGRDIDVGKGVASISRNYFGIPVRYLGHVAHDNAVWQALRKKRPLLIDYPASPINNQFFAIAKLILGPKAKKAVV